MITSMSINGGESELLGDVPADLFHPLAYGNSLPLPVLNQEDEIAVTFRNRSRYTFEVKSIFHVDLPSKDWGNVQTMLLPLNPFVAEPDAERTMSVKLQRAVRAVRFLVYLPKYVRPPELAQ